MPEIRPIVRSAFAPSLSSSKGLPVATSPVKLFARMSAQMRQGQIHAAAATLRNTINLERAIAVASNYTTRMHQSESEVVGAEFKVVALDARIEMAFKEFKEVEGFSEESLAGFLTNLDGLLADLAGAVPGLDLTKISQASQEFRAIYETYNDVFSLPKVAI